MKELCPAEALHEECGVFGIYDSTGKTNMVSAVYSALYALQHRGQESCGIGNHQHSLRLGVQVCVIRNKNFFCEHPLYYRVSAAGRRNLYANPFCF